MNYLCCPITCLVGHVRWLSGLCNDLWDRTINPNNERWVSLEESYQASPTMSRANTSLFFQRAENSQPIIATSQLPTYKK